MLRTNGHGQCEGEQWASWRIIYKVSTDETGCWWLAFADRMFVEVFGSVADNTAVALPGLQKNERIVAYNQNLNVMRRWKVSWTKRTPRPCG